MSAIVTDQFRISNADNFIESVQNSSNSYYVFLGLAYPNDDRYGGAVDWDSNPLNPVDSFDYMSHSLDTILFGKKITSSNVRRVVRRIDWVKGEKYEMYRHDYSVDNPSPIYGKNRLYDANYYVMNSEYKVYICIDNGSSGSNLTGNRSQDEPTFTDLEPSRAGESGDGYVWKYLFSISPSDIIKFDSTEYIVLPNDWSTSTDPQIISVRENGNSEENFNQIKKVYIKNAGSEYNPNQKREVDILGNGTGGRVYIETNENGKIVNTTVTSGGSGYTYGIVDLGSLQSSSNMSDPALLIPIIPPSNGHGYDIYKELGSDKVLIYSRFDDSTPDFPIDTKFAQIGVFKNPQRFNSTELFQDTQFSGLYSLKFSQDLTLTSTPSIGDKITQESSGRESVGYIASFDSTTKVLKYYKDRTLYYGNQKDQTDYSDVNTSSNANLDFIASGGSVSSSSINFGLIDVTFDNKSSILIDNKIYDLGVTFQEGVAKPEINKKTGEIIYLDNRPLVSRNSRQKEDIKIILEF